MTVARRTPGPAYANLHTTGLMQRSKQVLCDHLIWAGYSRGSL